MSGIGEGYGNASVETFPYSIVLQNSGFAVRYGSIGVRMISNWMDWPSAPILLDQFPDRRHKIFTGMMLPSGSSEDG